MVRHCPDCDTEIRGDDAACPTCGRSLETTDETGTDERPGAATDTAESAPESADAGTGTPSRAAQGGAEPAADRSADSDTSRRNLLIGGAVGLGLLWYLQRDDDGNPLDGGGTVRGSITENSPREPVYNGFAEPHPFTAETGDRVDISVESEDFDTYLVITDSSDRGLAEASDQDSLNSQLQWTSPENDEYTVWVASFQNGATGQYTLTLEFV